MDTSLINDSFLCPDSNWLLERTVLVVATVCVSNDWKRFQTPYVTDTSDQCAVYICESLKEVANACRKAKQAKGGWG